MRNWVGDPIDVKTLHFLWLTNQLVKSLFVEHFEVVFENSRFCVSLLSLPDESGLLLGSLFFESLPLSLDLFLLLLLSLFDSLFSFVFGKLLHDWVPLGKMLSFIDPNELSIVLKDEVLLVALDVLNRVVGKSIDLFGLLETGLWPSVIVLSISPSVLISQPEGDKTNDDLVNLPNWVPRLRMVMRDRKADSVIELRVSAELSVLSEHIDSWGLLWVFVWASDLTNIESVLASFWVLKTEDDEVPRVDILWVWKANEVIDDLSVLFDLSVVIFLGHFSFSLESHLTSFGSSFSLHCVHCIDVKLCIEI